MKAFETLSAKNLFAAIAAGLALTTFSAASATDVSSRLQAKNPTAEQGKIEHYGCDNKQGVEMYVQNLINDAKQRGVTCGVSMYLPASITSYCSICVDHPELLASCVKTGMEYLTNFCSQQQTDLTAAYKLPAHGAWL